MATRRKPLLDSGWPAITRLKTPNKLLDANGGSVLGNYLHAADGVLIRAAALTQTFGG
jgi:hypothetical protein